MKKEKDLRSLEEICKGKIVLKTLGYIYCGIKPTKKINCEYRAEDKDDNEMYHCEHPCHYN